MNQSHIKEIKRISLVVFILCALSGKAQHNDMPAEAESLIKAYPAQALTYENNHIVFKDGSKLIFDDGKSKQGEALLNNPDIQDMFRYDYPCGEINPDIPKGNDPGRIRNNEFFTRMYGATAAEVQKNLTEIVWCPKLSGQKLKVSTVNDADKHLAAVSAELDEHPEWKDMVKSAGAFNWRKISGTARISAHSLGIAIDLSVKYSNYWQWDCKCTDETTDVTYRNKIPRGIIDIFEKHGFIWGGKWYHYDTMHFEYRPELLEKCNEVFTAE